MKKIPFLLILFFLQINCSPISKAPAPNVTNSSFTPTPFEKKEEAKTVGGKPLFTIEDSPATYQKKDSLFQIAKENFLTNPKNLENIIWYGRRTAYLSK